MENTIKEIGTKVGDYATVIINTKTGGSNIVKLFDIISMIKEDRYDYYNIMEMILERKIVDYKEYKIYKL